MVGRGHPSESSIDIWTGSQHQHTDREYSHTIHTHTHFSCCILKNLTYRAEWRWASSSTKQRGLATPAPSRARVALTRALWGLMAWWPLKVSPRATAFCFGVLCVVWRLSCVVWRLRWVVNRWCGGSLSSRNRNRTDGPV